MMTRLLIVTTVSSTIRAFLLPYARHFRDKGWQVDALARDASSCKECSECFDNLIDISWSRSPFRPNEIVASLRQVREIVAKGHYDIVHVHTPVASFITRWALAGNQTPRLIYTAHGFHFFAGGNPVRNLLFRTLEQIAGRWTDYLVVINSEDAKSALALKLVPPDRLVQMPGIGISLEKYNPESVSLAERMRLRQELGIPDDGKIILQVGELSPRKRPMDLLAAFALVAEQHDGIYAVFAGDGPLRNDVAQRISKSSLQSRALVLGRRHDIPELLSIANSLVLPSSQEGLPRAVMEAMAMGVPVIGSDIRGTHDLLYGDCGLLYPVGDTAALSSKIQWVLENPDEVGHIVQKARARIANYATERIIAMHEDLYTDALAECGGAGATTHDESFPGR